MDFAIGSKGYESYCGTSYASKVLGISIGTVQGLVERGELRAWRTNGGHRRISLKSVQEYQHRHNLHPNVLIYGEERLKVVVVEDDEATRLMLQTNFDRWGLPLNVIMYASAIEAMLDMPTLHPQVLLTDLVMPRVNGFDFIKTLTEHVSFKSMAVVAMTGLRPEQVKAKAGCLRACSCCINQLTSSGCGDFWGHYFGATNQPTSSSRKKPGNYLT